MCSPLGHSSPIHPKHTSPPPFPPSPALSAMNMDRFEKGPREILNPEIQKVRLASPVCFFSRRARSAASELYITPQAGLLESVNHDSITKCPLSPGSVGAGGTGGNGRRRAHRYHSCSLIAKCRAHLLSRDYLFHALLFGFLLLIYPHIIPVTY